MSASRVESIHVAPERGAAAQSVAVVEVVAGQGLVGDRHFKREGAESKRQITLIEAEALDALARDYQLEIDPGGPRRNIVTRGIALNHLVGREFRIGSIRVVGTILCEPCDTVEKATKPGVRAALVHRGGLCARILDSGEIRVGDPIEVD